MRFITLTCIVAIFFSSVWAKDSYVFESIPTPPTKYDTQQIDALCFTPKGDLVVALPCGEIWKRNAKDNQWKLFAEGMHNPLGIFAYGENDFVVAQRPEITRVRDTDGDGLADDYECLSDDFGMSGNYHEFNFTPVQDKEGNIYFGLGTASRGNGIRQIVRGKFDVRGRPGRMHAAVPYRGWVLKITKDGKTIPWSSGHRTPNGLGFDLQGRLYVTDNQGDWVGTSKIFHVKQGHFYGHAASLNWKNGFTETALRIGTKRLDQARTRACIVLPHGLISNSPTQPLADATKGKFGPFAGQLFVGEMNKNFLIRVVLEEVAGEMQGVAIPFAVPGKYPVGGNRLAFAPDGSLYIGHTKHTWLGSRGISKISFTGEMPFEVLSMKLTAKGFLLEFTKKLDEKTVNNLDNWLCKRYWYSYHEKYGSKQFGNSIPKVESAKLSADGKKVELLLSELVPWTVHELELKNLRSKDGDELKNNKLYYTLNRLLKDTPKEPRQWDAHQLGKK